MHDLTPSAVCFVTAMTSETVIPWPSRTPNEWLRDSGDMHVAMRSPTPASPAKVTASPTEGRAEPHRLGQAAGDDRRLGVVAHAQALGHADGERDDVLHGAADLGADDVGCRCRGGSRVPRRPTRRARPSAALADATTEAAGCLTAISRARFGPDTMTMRSGSTPADLGDDLGHPLGGAELDALHQGHDRRRRRQRRAPRREVGAQGLRGHGQHDDVGARRPPRPGRSSRGWCWAGAARAGSRG